MNDRMTTEPVARRGRRALQTVLPAASLSLLWMGPVHAQHGHLNAGASSTAQGSALVWGNGALFAESSGYVLNMPRATSGVYAGYYGSGPTLTALPATIAYGGPSAGASALGSFLRFQYTLVSGPVGGAFSFWDHGAVVPSESVGVGATSSLYDLSGGDDNPSAGTPGGDPHGHIHGRRFTADLPGDYVVGFQAFDTSSNGTGGGNIHMPSGVVNIRFRVIPETSTTVLLGVGGVLLFACVRKQR
jgi:hypothetical protein